MGFYLYEETNRRAERERRTQEANRVKPSRVRLQTRKAKEATPMQRVRLTRRIKLRAPATLAWSNPNPLTKAERMFQRRRSIITGLLTELIEDTPIGPYSQFHNDAQGVVLQLMASDRRLYQEFEAVMLDLRQREDEEEEEEQGEDVA
jgi:hypothetical protein